MSVTKNYAIARYDAGDLAGLLSVYDVAMDRIDEILYGFDVRITNNTTDIANIKQEIENIYNEIKDIKEEINNINNEITNLTVDSGELVQQIVDKVHLGGVVDMAAKKINWQSDDTQKIAIGNICLFSNEANTQGIKASAGGDGDILVVSRAD